MPRGDMTLDDRLDKIETTQEQNHKELILWVSSIKDIVSDVDTRFRVHEKENTLLHKEHRDRIAKIEGNQRWGTRFAIGQLVVFVVALGGLIIRDVLWR